MEFELSTQKSQYRELFDALQWALALGLALVGLAYAGSLWTTANTKTAALAQCEQMLPNLTIDCAAAQAVAECVVAYPGSKCEVTR